MLLLYICKLYFDKKAVIYNLEKYRQMLDTVTQESKILTIKYD